MASNERKIPAMIHTTNFVLAKDWQDKMVAEIQIFTREKKTHTHIFIHWHAHAHTHTHKSGRATAGGCRTVRR